MRNDEDSGKCPACGGETSFGYGFAGGGLGAYVFCLDCDLMISKSRDDEGDCFNGIVERGESGA